MGLLLLGWVVACLETRGQTTAPAVAGSSGHALAEAGAAHSFPVTKEITFGAFLEEVAAENLDYASQRYNVSIARAAVAAARIFQNPTLSLIGGRDVSHSGREQLPSSVGAAFTQTLELGGKRKYRILGARQNYAAAAATLEDFLLNLKFAAAAAFADALALSRSAEQKQQSADYLRRLLDTQRQRLRAGDISRMDMLQTQVEEEQFQNELLAAQAEAENASLALNGFLGRGQSQTRLTPKGTLESPARQFDLSRLLAGALERRPDLLALRQARAAAQSKVREEKANRFPNVDAGIGWTHNNSSDNSISPSPDFDFVGLTLSFPVPLWNRNRPAIAAARFGAEQAEKQLEAAELKALVQIRQGFTAYRSAVARVQRYQGGILKDADAVLEAKRFSYQRGQSTLLELLDAQRTANDVRSSYNAALADRAKALVDLERAAGIWDFGI